MGIFNMFRNQTIGVIEWTEQNNDTLVYKYDCGGKDIMMGAQLTVREGQNVIFVDEGELADIFTPGRYALDTSNMPVMTRIQSWRYGFNSPFKSDVYFINMHQFMGCKWGTANPVLMRDPDFGAIRMRAFGNYAFRVTDVEKLMRECFGTRPVYKVSDIDSLIKRDLVSVLSDAVAASGIAALDLAANYDELGALVLANFNPRVEQLGIQLTSFVIENISLPAEVEKAMDRYLQLQAAGTMLDGEKNAAALAEVVNQATQAPAQAETTTAASTASPAYCSACGKPLAPNALFCSVCGAKQGGNTCPSCGKAVLADAIFCASCGKKIR